MKDSVPVPLSQIVCDVLPSYFKESSFLVKLWEHWPQLNNIPILQKAKPIGYKSGRLVLWVEGSVVLQELHFYIEELRNQINLFFKKESVQEIHFTVNKQALQRHLRSMELMKKIKSQLKNEE